jgi:DNA-binding NarL/FixJ family response regulator
MIMKPSPPHYRILIVDDDEIIRESIVLYLGNYHEPLPHAYYSLQIDASPDPQDARKKLADAQYDLVISDIQMPYEDGFSFLSSVQHAYPQTKTALITAYNVNDYIRTAKKTGICNIIAKTAPFNFEELSNTVNNLLTPEAALGLENYMMEGCPLQELMMTGSHQIMSTFHTLKDFFAAQGVRDVDNLSTAMIEAITNAIYHAAKLPDGALKYEKGQTIAKLEEEEYVFVYFARDAEKIGVSIVDQGGRITADEILYWLDRNISGSGILDSHGRGVYLIHTLVDRLIINISPGHRTEIIVLDYFSDEYSYNKPLYINQI